MGRDDRQRAVGRDLLLAALVLTIAAIGYGVAYEMPPVGDESYYLPYIRKLAQGDFHLDPMIPAAPGYFFVMAAVRHLTGWQSLDALRLVNLSMGLFALFIFYRAARTLQIESAPARTLQLFLLPFLFPVFFLIYGDTFSLLLLLAAVLAHLRGKTTASGLFATTGMAVRQTNVIWLAMLFVMKYVAAHGAAISRARILNHLRDCWAFVFGGLLFIGFVAINGGVAIGDSSSHPSLVFRIENVFFALLTFGLLFLPLNVSRVPAIVTLVRRRPVLIAALFALFLVYMRFFSPDHPYNAAAENWYLRNQVLSWIAGSTLVRALGFVPIAWMLLSLATLRLVRGPLYLLYPFSVLLLLPIWLIEPRYYIPIAALFLAFREADAPSVEWSTVVSFALIDLWILPGSMRGDFLP